MNCWKCQKPLEELKILFRTTCAACNADQHVCVNCRYYAPGKPNDCLVPGTDYVRDREAMNFCDDFKVKTDIAKPPQEKKKFNSLFKDDEP